MPTLRRNCRSVGAGNAPPPDSVTPSTAIVPESNELTITGKSAFKEEFVTCGGVRLGEVNFNTMESRLCPGLYFAGELLDIDGITPIVMPNDRFYRIDTALLTPTVWRACWRAVKPTLQCSRKTWRWRSCAASPPLRTTVPFRCAQWRGESAMYSCVAKISSRVTPS
jgi:hypothetical protein